MKICQIMLAKGFGGAERYYVDLVQALAEKGHDVLAISHTDAAAAKMLDGIPGVQQHCVSVLGKWDPFVLRKMRAMITAHKAELVQAHLARGAFIAGKITRRLHIPLLVHTHNFVKLKYYKAVDTFIPCTNVQHQYLVNAGIAPDKIRLIRNFSAFKPVEKAHCGQAVKKIVAHGRFVHKKGFDLLLKSFAAIPNDDVQLHIAGDGPERGSMLRLAQRLGLAKQVHFPGWQHDIREFLLQGDLFVLPSRDEPFGIALLEAMACGVPIVSTLCHGPLEILDESVACLCAPDDAKSLSDALKTAMQDTEGRAAKAQAALKLFQTHYSIDRAVDQFETLYRETLMNHSETSLTPPP